MDLGLKDKRCLITGASRGIGASIAKTFLGEGARVLLVARGADDLNSKAQELEADFGSTRVKTAICDCTNPVSLELLEKEIETLWDGIDIVVANVGDGRGPTDPIPTNSAWEEVWSNNFESALHTARTFLRMLQQSRGCLLFISSIAGKEFIGAPVDYSTAKTAILALSKNMATKVAPKVRVNVLCPGNVMTVKGSWAKKFRRDPEGVTEMLESTVPMKRFGKPEEIADAAAFLCSDRSSFITGSVLVIDGGQTVSLT